MANNEKSYFLVSNGVDTSTDENKNKQKMFPSWRKNDKNFELLKWAMENMYLCWSVCECCTHSQQFNKQPLLSWHAQDLGDHESLTFDIEIGENLQIIKKENESSM